MPIESFDNKFNKQLTNKLQAQVEHAARIPLQNQQAALVKVNEVMASLQFPLGQRLNLPIGQSQSSPLHKLLNQPSNNPGNLNNRVLVNLVNNQLTITPTQQNLVEIPLSNQHKQAIVELALSKEVHSSAVKGRIIHAQAENNFIKFNLNGQTYQLDKNQLSLPQNYTGAVLLKITNNTTGSVSVELLSPKSSSNPASLNKLELEQSKIQGQLSHGKMFLPSGDIELKQLFKQNLPNNTLVNARLNIKNDVLELNLGDGKTTESNKLASLASDTRQRIEQTFKPQLSGINLIKPVSADANGNQYISLVGVKITVSHNNEQKVPYVNIAVNEGIAELTLSSGEKKQLVLPEKNIIQNLTNSLTSKDGKTISQLQDIIKTLPKDLAITIESAVEKTLAQNNSANSVKFHLSSAMDGSSVKLTASSAAQINIPLNKEMLNQLKEWGWVSKPNIHISADSNTNKISDSALLQQLQTKISNPTQDPSLNVSQQIKQLVSGLNHKNNTLDAPLNQLMQMLNNQQIDLPSGLKSALTNLNTSMQQPDANQVKQQILEQVQLPQFSLTTSVNLATNSNGIANAMVSALQQIFMAKAKRQTTNNQVEANKTTNKSSNKSSAIPSQSVSQNSNHSSNVSQKLTQALAQSIRNMQNNQLHSAKSQIDNQNQIFATLPILGNEALQQLDLAIQIDTDAESNRADTVKMWRFSLKFNMGDLGNMLAKAVYVEGKLKINLYTETQKLLELGENNIQQLKENLSKLGIVLEEYNFNLGKIPSQLWNESALSMQYRLV